MNNNHKLLIRALANTANNSHIQYINTELMMPPLSSLLALLPVVLFTTVMICQWITQQNKAH